MKKIITIVTTIAIAVLNSFAQVPTSIYEVPASGNQLNRFEHDDSFLYAVRDSSVDKIDATTNTISKLFNKPWGASINANGKAIFSNGKSIIGQYITGSPYRYKYWVYDGANFDTLFSLVNTQIDNWVIDGNNCYFYISANKKVYKSDFTKAGTVEIATVSANTLLVNLTMFNHDLYFFNTTSSVNNNVFKKYSSNILTTIDSSYNYSLGDFKMAIYNNDFYYSHYQFILTPNARYKSKIIKINSSGTATILYSDTLASAIYAKGFMGGVSNTLFMNASVGATSNEYVYKLNAISGGTPTTLQNSSGDVLKPQSSPLFQQGSSLVYLDVYDPSNPSSGNRDLWQTDGTAFGTRMVVAPTATNITHANGFSLGNVDQWCLQGVTCGDNLYSVMNYADLWVEDGTTFPVKIAMPNYFAITSLVKCAGQIFMRASNTTTYKPNILKLGCASTTAISTIEADKNHFMVYPNPTNEMINLKLEITNGDTIIIEVTNTLGQVVLSKTITENKTSLNVSDFTKGIYYITVKSDNKVSTQKLIVN